MRTIGLRRGLILVALGVVLGACGVPAPAVLGPAPGATSAAVTPDDLRLRVGILADDSLRGRETGTPGIAAAARYLSTEMARLGLQPAGDDGTFLHEVPLERTRISAFVRAATPAGPMQLGMEEILPISGLAGLPRASRSSGEGPLIFGGHLVDPSVGAEELSLEQLRDAVVIVRVSVPDGVDPNAASPRMAMATLFSPASRAAAVLLVAEAAEGPLWQYANDIAVKGELRLGGTPESGPTAPPFFLISEQTATRLLGSSLATARQPRIELGTFEYSLTEQVTPVEAWNVAAIFPGRDPALRQEYVGLGAHYDHVGVGTPVNGDSIYNGADDNASGTSALVEIAEVLAHLPPAERPARSVLFVWNTAEEAGLLGSDHFTNRPTVPRQAIIAHLNLDMVGRNRPDSLFIVGASRLSTALGSVVEEVNGRQAPPFFLDYSYDAPGHPEQVYCRSDHYNYARYGIPIVFLTTGLHDDYHAPSDEPLTLDYEKLARVSRYVLGVTRELADRPARPTVDQPVPPLGAPCS